MGRIEKRVVFFSHSAEDRDQLSRLRELVLGKYSHAIKVFLSSDGESIPLGTNWIEETNTALKSAALMIVFLSPNSLESRWVLFESGYALGKETRIVPVGINGTDIATIPPPLSLLQGFNVTDYQSLDKVRQLIDEEFGLKCEYHFTEREYADVFAAAGPKPEVEPIRLLPEPKLVTAKMSGNFPRVEADFLLSPSGTIVLGVLVHEKGEGIRHAPPSQRYILAHSTEELPNSRYRNLFCVRYRDPQKDWDLLFTNHNAYAKHVLLPDSLEPGWHQLVVAWSPKGGYMAWDNLEGMMSAFDASAFAQWPGEVASSVNLGCFHRGDKIPLTPAHFCETELWRLEIHTSFIPIGDARLKEHLRGLQQTPGETPATPGARRRPKPACAVRPGASA